MHCGIDGIYINYVNHNLYKCFILSRVVFLAEDITRLARQDILGGLNEMQGFCCHSHVETAVKGSFCEKR